MDKITIQEVLFWALLLLLPLWYISYHFKRRRLYELASKINGPTAFPIVGNSLKFLLPPEKVAKAILDGVRYYKSPTKLWVGSHLILHIWDPKQLKIVLNSPHCMEKPQYLYKLAEPVMGKGLLSLPVEQWKRHRRIIAPILNKKNVKSYLEIIHTHAKDLVKNLRAEQGMGFFDVKNYLLKHSLEIALDAILGFDSNKDTSNTDQYLEWLEDLQEATVYKMTKLWYLPDFLFNITSMGRKLNKAAKGFNSCIDAIIRKWETEALKQHKESGTSKELPESSKPVKFVEYLLSISDENGKLTADELRNEVKTIINGAFDTTALSLGSLLLVLGMFPEVQEKVYQEINEVIKFNEQIQFENVQKLQYLDRVIKETLRIFPVGPGMARCLDQNLQLDEYILPAGCTILIGMFSVHRDPNYWPNPTKFDPDRFLPEEEAKRHPYSWIGFSAGPRGCVGFRFALLSLKVTAIELIRNYKIATIYKDVEDIDLKFVFLFQPIRGYNIKLECRK